jgi:hypothetical protein
MFYRLQRMINRQEPTPYRVDNDRFASFYGSMAARNFARGEARRDIDIAMYRMSIRL